MSDRSLIIGGSGMVGQNIHFGIKPRSSDLNILDEKSILNYLDLIETPDCIIHLAALNIRDCEKSPSKAIKILTYKNDIVLDPFMGSGTSAVAAETLGRRWLGIELSPNYTEIARKRVNAFIEERKQLELELKEV